MHSDPGGKSPIQSGPKGGKPRILVAPLDWGLGHATRCIPIIRELLRQEFDVWLAGDGHIRKLLNTEFPQLPFLDLPGYQVKYARSAAGLFFSMLWQSLKITKAIRRENNWLKQIQETHHFDAILSDNRYGLYHKNCYSIFMTHQLLIKSPLGQWSEKILQRRNYRYINRFNECWVPDFKENDGLAGELSHPQTLPGIPVNYTGILSRFIAQPCEIKKNHLLLVLSGPEPQRSILENIFIREIGHYNFTATLVRGLPDADQILPSTNMLKMFNHLDATDLENEMKSAEFIIGRCGYSSVMDIVRLHKKSILIPTPGQTEQEYLAKRLMQKQIAFCMQQQNFSLVTALENARQFNYTMPVLSELNPLAAVIDTLHQKLTVA